ncbi:MAG: putative signal transducing protein [Muribaculaceae bacterium]
MKKHDDDKAAWTVIRSYGSEAEAFIDKGMLENFGIECVVNNDVIASVYPMTATWAPIEIMVPKAQAERARAILDRREV